MLAHPVLFNKSFEGIVRHSRLAFATEGGERLGNGVCAYKGGWPKVRLMPRWLSPLVLYIGIVIATYVEKFTCHFMARWHQHL